MFIETIDKLLSEFQQRLGTKTSIPWGWFFTKLATLLSRYPTGVTKAIMYSELECAWRKIEKLQAKGGMHSADSLSSIVLSKHLSPQTVFEVFLKEVKIVQGTHTRIAVITEESSGESSFTMEMFLHQKLYAEVDEIMANGFKLRFTGCRLFSGRRKKSSSLLPSESFVVLVSKEQNKNFCQNFASLEGLDQLSESQYICSIIKVRVTEISPQEPIHNQNGNTVARITVLVTDDVGIQAKFQLWEDYLAMANLFEEGDTLYIKRCFLVPDDLECFVLEYGPETVIFCQPLIHEQEMLLSQKTGSKLLYVAKDNKGMLDCSMYPERLEISEIKQNMTNITLAGQVVSVGGQTLRGEGIDMVKYQLRVQDESGVCTIVVMEPYKNGTVLHCGQFVLMKNLHVSSDYSMGVTMHLNTDKDGQLWNLSCLQGWLATSSLCTVTSLASLDLESSWFVLKGLIFHIRSRVRDESVVRVHLSCSGHVVEDMDGQFKCEICHTKGMAEMTVHNNAMKLFNLNGFWCWQFNLCITIMESEQQQLQVDISNKVGEKLLQLPAGQFRELSNDGQRRVFECTLGQECLFGLSNFKGELLVSAINQI